MQEHIRHSNLIEGIDSPDEDLLSMAAWEWLIGTVGHKPGTMSITVILNLHKLITVNQLPPHECGQFRQIQVYVGNHIPPSGEIMQAEIYGWGMDMIQRWQELEPKDMHVRFEKIHPFVDGNGRTGRMLMWLHEYWLGREPTLIRSNEADRHYYYQWFREAQDD